MAGWKIGLALAEKKMAQEMIVKELAKYYNTPCSMKVAVSRINTELRKRDSNIRIKSLRDSVKKCEIGRAHV